MSTMTLISPLEQLRRLAEHSENRSQDELAQADEHAQAAAEDEAACETVDGAFDLTAGVAVADVALAIDGDVGDLDCDLDPDIESSATQDCWYAADTPLDLGNDPDVFVPSAALLGPAAFDATSGLLDGEAQIVFTDPQDL